jgi:secreted PhoX family phosphatase
VTQTSRTRAQAFEASEDIGRNPTHNSTLGDVVAARFDRRDVLKGLLGVAAIAATVRPFAVAAANARDSDRASAFNFLEIEAAVDCDHHVANGYDADILIRWGDPVLPGAPDFDRTNQTAASQKLQFGYNNDFLGYFPMPGAADPSRHGLLVVNHESTNTERMLPGLKWPDLLVRTTVEIADIEMAAHGGTVIEIAREHGRWRVIPSSDYARRIDMDTPIEITGPAAGHARLATKADPSGRRVYGMLNNCGGGTTPWGTWLSCEENFHGYFWGAVGKHKEAQNHTRYGVAGNWYVWGKFHDRFDVTKEPNEANRFGWIVEIDPFDPRSTPKKRTALGRMKHEGAAGILNKDGRYVIYMGDDECFEYVYRFVTDARVDPSNPSANRHILDSGTLSVARYCEDGALLWLPLVHGQGPLTAENDFFSQADVLIETRRAADLLGATKMDRPEDVEANPRTGKIYVSLTNNSSRTPAQIDVANPRADNRFGHMIEMIPPDGDHAANSFSWGILLVCGDPSVAAVGAGFSTHAGGQSWFARPDNIAIDGQGRLWVATDGNSPDSTERGDGIWAVETEGPLRGTSRQFYRVPAGAELCGPVFTPDDGTLFVAVQHPPELNELAGSVEVSPKREGAWPDFQDGLPPRPAVVGIVRHGGGKIGT